MEYYWELCLCLYANPDEAEFNIVLSNNEGKLVRASEQKAQLSSCMSFLKDVTRRCVPYLIWLRSSHWSASLTTKINHHSLCESPNNVIDPLWNFMTRAYIAFHSAILYFKIPQEWPIKLCPQHSMTFSRHKF